MMNYKKEISCNHLRPVLDAAIDGVAVVTPGRQELAKPLHVHIDVVVGLHHILCLQTTDNILKKRIIDGGGG